MTAILDAKRPDEVFGKLEGSRNEQMDALGKRYRKLARETHPDARPGDPQADEEFARLTELYKAASVAVEHGTYGTERAPLVNPIEIRTKRRTYKVSEALTHGDSCNIYKASFTSPDGGGDALVKIPRGRAANDLVVNEAKTLKAILSNKDTYDTAQAFLPSYIETFGVRMPPSKKPLQSVAFGYVPNLVPLTAVRKHPKYRDGVHPKDMAWIMRRLLIALGIAAKNGVVHGAVLPPHILIEPAQHGLVLCDWKYAVKAGEPIKAISGPYRYWYPPEVHEKEATGPGTDVFLAMRSLAWVMGGDGLSGRLPFDAPKPLKAFFRGSSMKLESKRPQDPWVLLEEFNELIEKLWGPRRFRPFEM